MGGDGAEQQDHDGGGDAEPPRLVRDHGPIVWEDRPPAPAVLPPGWLDRLSARHPAASGAVLGSPVVLTLAIPPGLARPWWAIAGLVAAWLLLYPAVNTWLWRAGGRRRRDYDRRVRASMDGAARLSG